MSKKHVDSNKINYVKPVVLDLGAIEVTFGLCKTGISDTGDCTPSGQSAVTACLTTGWSAAAGNCSIGNFPTTR